MKFLKTIIALVLTLCFLQSAGGQELRTRSRLIKENAELRSRVDSLIRELEAYRLEKSVADSLAAEMLLMLEEMEEMDGVDEPVEEYSPEMTDSLLSLWYVHRQMEVNKELTEYDMDSVKFTSDVPDAVLIERLAILEHGESGRPYNVGSDRAVSIRELAETVRAALGSNSEIVVKGAPVPGAKPSVYVPNIDRARNELGLEVKVALEDSIRLSV